MPKIEQKIIDDIINAFVEIHPELQSPYGNLINGLVNGERMTYAKLAVIYTLAYVEDNKKRPPATTN